MIQLVENALLAHEQGADAAAQGDEAGAELLRDAAERSWDLAASAIDSLAGLA